MAHMLSIRPAIGHLAMMFGAAAIGRLVIRTSAVRALWSRRRLRGRDSIRT
jgi:hypothetical protein